MRKILSGLDYLDELDKKIVTNKILWAFGLINVLIIFLLLIGYFNLRSAQSVKITYLDGRVSEVRNNLADIVYYEIFAKYNLAIASNFTPDNIEEHVRLLKRFFLPSVYEKYKVQFVDMERNVKTNRFEQTFSYKNADIEEKLHSNRAGADFIFSGIATQKVGSVVNTKECSYKITVVRYGGEDYVKSFSTDCYH